MPEEEKGVEDKKIHPLSASAMFPKLSKSIDEGIDPKRNKSSLWNWKLTPEDLEEQVTKYDTLPLNKSYRGQTSLAYLVLLSLTLVIGYFNVAGTDIYAAIAQVIIFAPFVIFTYLGHRWAMIFLIVLETVNRLLEIKTGVNGAIILIWWALFVSLTYKTYQVEKERERRLKTQTLLPPLIS